MAIVVESVSATVSANATTTITITKPTGLAEGDLMVAVLSTYAADGTMGSGPPTFATLSGWSDAQTNAFASDVGHSIQYKIADSGDVAASDFTFTSSATTDLLTGKILRCSGHNTLNPLGSTSTYTNETADSTTFAATHSAYTPGADGALVVIQVSGTWPTGSGARTTASYTTTNVTYTEGYDTNSSDGSGGAHVASAYGIQSTAAEISAYGATYSSTANDHYGQIAIFLPPVNATGSNTIVTTTSTTFAATGIADTIASNDLATASTTTFTQGGLGTSPTQWTTTNKPSTTWTTTDK